MTDGSNSDAALRGLFERLIRIETQAADVALDRKELGKEIVSAGFSHRALKKLAKAQMDADAGKPKTMERLREDHGDLAVYLDVLVPEKKGEGEPE